MPVTTLPCFSDVMSVRRERVQEGRSSSFLLLPISDHYLWGRLSCLTRTWHVIIPAWWNASSKMNSYCCSGTVNYIRLTLWVYAVWMSISELMITLKHRALRKQTSNMHVYFIWRATDCYSKHMLLAVKRCFWNAYGGPDRLTERTG